MSAFHNFSSMPPNAEQTFIVYEQRMEEASKKGFTLGAIAGVIVLVIAAGIYLGVEPEHIDYSKDMNMSNLTKKEDTSAPAPAPAPAQTAPAPAPAPAPTTAPAADPGAAPAAGSAPAAAPAAGTAPAEAPAPK